MYDKYSESYHGDVSPLIEIEMSQTQFSEAITSMNMGSGVPVTLKGFAGKWMPNCQELTLRERIDEDLKDTFSALSKRINKDTAEVLNQLLAKKSPLTVADKDKISGLFRGIAQEIGSNIPFLKQCMDEAIDKSTSQAKGEIEAFWQTKLNALGIAKLNELESTDTMKLIEK